MAALALRVVDYLENTRHRVLLLFAASLLISSVFRLAMPDSRKTDFDPDYAPQVASLLAGTGFVSADGGPLYRYPPVFPLLLAGSYRIADVLSVNRGSIIFLASALLIAASSVIIFAIARSFFTASAAFLSAVVFASHPHVLYLLLMPMSETPFMVLFFGSVFFLLKALSGKEQAHQLHYAIGCGVLLGLAMLTRPIALFLPGVFAISMILWGHPKPRAKFVFCLLFVSTVSLVISPWEVFLYKKRHEVVLLSSGGVPGLRDGLSFNNKTVRQKLELPKKVEQLSNEAWVRDRSFATSRDIKQFLLEKLRQKPTAVAELFALKAVRAWFGTDSQDPRLELINKVLLIVYGPVVGLGLFSYWRDRKGELALPKTIVLLVCYFWFMTILVLSIARYMVPAVGLLLIFAAYPIERSARRFRATLATPL